MTAKQLHVVFHAGGHISAAQARSARRTQSCILLHQVTELWAALSQAMQKMQKQRNDVIQQVHHAACACCCNHRLYTTIHTS
jgi:hypothetical protein